MKNIQIILFILFSSLAGIAQNPIVDFEYYVDEDPGYMLATPIPIAPGLLHELDFTIPTDGLSKGFHVAGMRGRDDRNNWSHDYIQFFYVDLLQHEDDPITQVEYFIDTDPGIGKATPVSITPGRMVDLAFNLDVNMLEPGFHFLSVRSASENNVWSHAYTRMFLMDVLDGGESPITRVEYFINEDPGIGNANPVTITPGKVVELAFNLDVSMMEPGFHFLSVRSASGNNVWSHAYTRMFLMDVLDGGESPITRVEYFIDEDPGIGNATPVSITPGKVVELTFDVDVNSLEPGFHFISVRSASENDVWSHAYTHMFLIDVMDGGESPITRVEYFIDEDPGIGNASPVAITPGKVVDLSFEVDLSEQEPGFHFITVRSQSEAGTWSTGFYQMFYINKISSFSNPNLTAIEYFLDEDPGFGNGSTIAINPPEPLADQDFVVDLGQVEPGEHILYLRSIDEFNNWSIVAYDTVLVEIGSAFALRFDGEDDYLEAGDFQFPAGDLTIEAWIKAEEINTVQEIVFAFGENDGVQFRLNAGGSLLYGESTSESWDYVISEPAAVLSGRWTHLAVTKSEDHCNLYINGIHAGYYQFDNNPITTTLNIGGRSTNMDRFFDGEMDEVRIWEVARSQQEIRNNLCANLIGNEAGLYALWHFDEGPGSPTAADSGPNGFGAWFYNMEPNAGPDCSWIDHSCELPPSIDLAIQSITAPDDLIWNAQGENIPVSIIIKNYGMDDFDSLISISYILDANSPITENPSLSIPAGESVVFEFTTLIDLSSIGFHNLEVEITAAGDEYPDNDILEKVIETVTLSRKVFAFNTWPNQSGLPQGPVVFDIENPEHVFSLADQSSEEYLKGGAWVDEHWYGIANDTLYTIDTITGNRTFVGVPGSFISSLAYDASSNKLFGLSWVSLEEIDPLTGNSTYIGYSGTEGFTAMACNAEGLLYALNIEDDQLYQLNKASGEATAIGSIGFDAQYEQDMDFDPLTGNIYMTAFNDDAGQGELRTIDPLTGNTTYLGTFRGGMELSGFAIPLEIVVLDAEFSAVPLSGISPLEVRFSDLSSGNPDSWLWDFGDGETSEVQNPTHVYHNPGSYTVSLKVSDGVVSDEIIMGNLIQVNEPGQGNWLAEYFFDNDPGYGQATPIYANGDDEVMITFNAPVNHLADGLHTFYSRSKNENGSWSQTMARPFIKQVLPEDSDPNITYLEYFFDDDPGYGQATPIAVDAQSPLEIAVNLPLEELDYGIHTLYVRSQDENGKWSIVMQRSFIMGNFPADPLKALVKAEYFINEDPGQGNAEPVMFDPNNGIHQQEFDANLDGLEWGEHTFYVRTMDESGGWSITVAEPFNVEEPPIIAEFSADITAGFVPLAVQFTDETFISEPTVWLWDFGDGNSSNIQNPQHTYANPGTYTVSLTATNDEGTDTEIKENYITVYPPVYALEYFFDDDPGYGNASGVYTYSADLGGFNFMVPLDELTDGYHLLFVRIQDTAKVWTQTFSRSFLKTRLVNDLNPNISIMEYFVDTDPGFGHGISLPVSQSAVPVVETLIPLDGYADGLHNIFVRSQDENGRWSETMVRPFLKSYLPSEIVNVARLEYFIDTDPGTGNGTSVSVPNPQANVERSFLVYLGSQIPGEHRLFVRAIDSRGSWSIIYNQLIEVTATGAVQIVQLPEGWSGISSFIIPDDAAVANIFAPVQDELVILQNFDGMYWPTAGVNTLGNWDDQAGYQIKMETAQQVTFSGELQSNLTASLDAGWNYLPVLNACENDAEELFGQIANELQIVKEVAGLGVYWPQFGVNTLGALIPGKAYFVLVNDDVEVEFPVCTPSNSPSRGRTDPASELQLTMNNQSDNSDVRSSVAALRGGTPFLFKGNTCPDYREARDCVGLCAGTPITHTIAIPLQAIFGIAEGSIITIYNQFDLCCGAAIYQNQNLAFTAFGDDPTTPQIDGLTEGEPLQFRVFNPETGKAFVLEVVYDDQMPHSGTFVNHGLSAVKDLKITTVEGFENPGLNFSVYPNPSSGIFQVSTLSKFNWEVSNTHGSIITTGDNHADAFTIDLSTYPKGIYYLKITQRGWQTVEKLVVQ